MNKFIKVLLAALLLSGCAAANEPGDETPEETVPEKTELKILAPSGAPSIAMLGAFEDGFEITTVDGPDALQAAFANPEPEYDVIVAPTNLGVKLIQAGKAQYRLYDVLVWGNLYLLGTSADVLENPDARVAAFGEAAVTGLVFKKEFPELAEKAQWYPSVADARAALLAGEADVTLIAEPAATATMAAGKDKGLDLVIVADLQEQWPVEGGYPQASLFVRSDLLEENPDAFVYLEKVLKDYADEMNAADDKSAVAELVEKVGADVLGVPNGQIIAKTWNRMGIRINRGADVIEELNAFLSIFGIADCTEAVAK
ncbi:MAG: hypothetical protein IKF51_06500 [Solobacterium sp.]|nr:hypothetical protein [Solobacterium sp.]